MIRLTIALLCLLALSACSLDALFGPDENVQTWGADEASGSVGERIDIGFLPGQELFKAEHEDGGVWAEIATVSNDYGNLWVELELRLHNRFEERLLFDMEDVRLSYQGEDYPARPIGLRGESGISIRGKNWIKERWKFEIGTWVDAGVYDVTLKNLRVLRDSKPVPVDLGLTFPLRVPGEKPLDSGC